MNKKQFNNIAKALSDPRRLEILKVIAESGEISCGTIADRFPVGQSTVSHHLKLLADSGLVSVRREGQHGFYSANPDIFEEYIKELQEVIFNSDSKRDMVE
ncbi:MAG: helix-turn-helix transcriptional regulator [Chlorobi bacterium]|nr:helix-turn-helix transcriptional regulator [Chlorobiota bacterium]